MSNQSTPTISTRTRLKRSNSASDIIKNSNSTSKSKQTSSKQTTNKRKLHTTSPTEPSNSAKKQTTMATLTIDDIKALLTNQTDQLQQTIVSAVRSEVQALGNELKASIQSEIDRIDKKIDSVQQQYVTELTDLRSSVNHCVDRMNYSQDDFARIAKSNALKLSGLAHSTNENLQEIFIKIAQLIGFDVSTATNIPEMARLSKRNRDTNEQLPIPTVIMKFVAKHIRDKFYGLYISRLPSKPIKTEDIGLPQGGRITIGEDLTPLNQTIFNTAMNFKKEGKLVRVFTVDGLVQVRAKPTDKASIMRSLRELDSLIATSSSGAGSSSIPSQNSNQQQTINTQQQINGNETEITNGHAQHTTNGNSSNNSSTTNNINSNSNNNGNNNNNSTTNTESPMEIH